MKDRRTPAERRAEQVLRDEEARLAEMTPHSDEWNAQMRALNDYERAVYNAKKRP